jgi:hypothetical protein
MTRTGKAAATKLTHARKRIDFAAFVRDLVNGRCMNAIKVVLVMDNLNTHSITSLYGAFELAEAKRIAAANATYGNCNGRGMQGRGIFGKVAGSQGDSARSRL